MAAIAGDVTGLFAQFHSSLPRKEGTCGKPVIDRWLALRRWINHGYQEEGCV
jgi:hypothetical protein